MRCVIQRVSEAQVTVHGECMGHIGSGLVVLVCAMKGDRKQTAQRMARKVSRLRIFADERSRMNRSVMDTGASILAISQFTLAANTARGNRPGFSDASPPDTARQLFDEFVRELHATGLKVETGVFGAHMMLSLTNDGPVTIWLDLCV